MYKFDYLFILLNSDMSNILIPSKKNLNKEEIEFMLILKNIKIIQRWWLKIHKIKIHKINFIQNWWYNIYIKTNKYFECDICYDKFKIDSSDLFYHCNHRICNQCYSNWSQRNNSCPTCRSLEINYSGNNINYITDNRNNINSINTNNIVQNYIDNYINSYILNNNNQGSELNDNYLNNIESTINNELELFNSYFGNFENNTNLINLIN